jgi:hypothetical protein
MLQKHIAQYSEEELETWVQQLVTDECPESMTLEYKAEQSFDRGARLEIAKDISSFANTKGGVIIYGVPEKRVSHGVEEDAIPESEYGIAPIQNFEIRLESALAETVSPHLPDLWIKKVKVSQRPDYVVYVVWHPESWLGPHMVQASGEQNFHRRGLKRTIKMTEPEIREAYMRVQKLVGLAEQFLDSLEINYIAEFFPDARSVSQAVSCPQLLVTDRVDYTSVEMREWLEDNVYPQTNISRDRSEIRWYPSMHGVQAGMKITAVGQTVGQRTLYYWVELHCNGAVNILWQTHILKRDDTHYLDWRRDLSILNDFINFNKTFHEKIRYFGPLHFRFSVDKLALVELKPNEEEEPLTAQLPNNTLKTKLIEDSARLFENPNRLLQFFADRLFQAYGIWEAPSL